MLWGGRNTANKYHWHVWGVFTVSRLHWVCSRSQRVCFHGLHFSGSRLLCWELSEAGLGCAHFPGLSRSGSGSRVFHKGADSVGLRFVPFIGPSSSGDQVLGERGHRQVRGASYHLPCLSCSVFWVYNRRAFSGVPCVSSGELISGCDPPSRCQLSRIPRSLS